MGCGVPAEWCGACDEPRDFPWFADLPVTALVPLELSVAVTVDGFADEQPVTSTADKNSNAIFERIGANGSDRGHTLPVAPLT